MFENEDDPGLVAVAGELRRLIKRLTQPSASDGGTMQEQQAGSHGNLGRSSIAGQAKEIRNTFENSGNVAIQAGHQIIHGSININQSVLGCILCLPKPSDVNVCATEMSPTYSSYYHTLLEQHPTVTMVSTTLFASPTHGSMSSGR